jgi:hypothetical protein
MKTIISALIDNKVTGLIKSYALWHIHHCPRCQAALQALRDLHARLHILATKPTNAPSTLSEDRRSRLEAAWDAVEREAT